MKKLHLGCGPRDFGKDWIHVDLGNYDHLDIQTGVSNLSMIESESIDLIYASHIIAYFDQRDILLTLSEWHRVLKKGGVLRLATPDFEQISNLYQQNKITVRHLQGLIYGRMQMGHKMIFHKQMYDREHLSQILQTCGFAEPTTWNWREVDHGKWDDHSQAYIPHMDKENGTLVSLNLETKKL